MIDVQPAGDDVSGEDEVARSRCCLADRNKNVLCVLLLGRLLVFDAQPEGIGRCRLYLERDDTARFGVLSQHVGSFYAARRNAGPPATPS
jgi:hypothetical protein